MQTKPSKPLHQMFEAVPPRYDLINRVITLGMDEGWRRQAARAVLADNPKRILDVCCGTGDLALRLAKLSDAEITGLDYSEPMLEIARQKAATLPEGKKVTFLYGDVGELPFRDGYFDAVGISFAFRNLTYKNPNTKKYMGEILRVVRPGGRFVAVESSQPRKTWIKPFFRAYLRGFVYPSAYLLSGNKGAYKYLTESAANFFTPDQVRDLLLGVGFKSVQYKELFFGAAGIHIAEKG